jgi:hypothetical protein
MRVPRGIAQGDDGAILHEESAADEEQKRGGNFEDAEVKSQTQSNEIEDIDEQNF